jgi:hypothetical protein
VGTYTAAVDRYGLRQLVGVGVPTLVGLLGTVLVAASPECSRRDGAAGHGGLGDDGQRSWRSSSGNQASCRPALSRSVGRALPDVRL